jgi:hypothetical protein
LSIASPEPGCIETKAMKEIERTRTRSNISRIDRRGRTPCEHAPVETSAERVIRLKIEAEEAQHRRRREEAEVIHQHWKERLITKAVVSYGLGLGILCAVVMLAGSYMSPEVKEWAITTLKYSATALAGYMGCVAQKKINS